MKALFILALTALAVAASSVEEGRIHGENGWYVPQEDGSFIWMDQNEVSKMEMKHTGRWFTLTPVSFYLYTKENPTKEQKITATTESISSSNFNPNNPTRFVIHGWTQSSSADMNKSVRDAWFTRGDYNIIAVDWGRARLDYVSATFAVSTVGQKVAALIDFLVENYGMSLDTLHVIGHSLGAHVAGFAGKNVKSGQIFTIIGLDPALPLFSYTSPKKRLANTDAWYVETIHTNVGSLGFLQPLGKGAFYPNGGKSQPGCGWDLTGTCDHSRSTTYYVEAIQKNNFPSVKCSDYEQANKKKCGTQYSPLVRMGADTNAFRLVIGPYYVPVNHKSPFGMGE